MRTKRFTAAAAIAAAASLAFATPAFADGGDGSLSSHSSQTDRGGDFTFIIEGEDFNPDVDFRLHSEGLNGACRDGNSLESNPTVESDLDGDFTYTGTGERCIDGTYRVEVSEQSSPWRTFDTTVTVDHDASSSDSDDGNGSNPLDDVIGALPIG